MDLPSLVPHLPSSFFARCAIPRDLAEVTDIGEETPPREVRITRKAVDGVWQAVEALYQTGVYPAVQVCIRRSGATLLHRAIGHTRGNAPGGSLQDAEPVSIDTPFLLYSASKAITAMLVHKLDEIGKLHIEDRVSEYLPEFGHRGKRWITIRHVLSHRAGIPNIPPDALDLALLEHPEQISQILADAQPRTRPGRLLAYHAVSGGFVLGEVIRRATGEDPRTVLEREIRKPLGLRNFDYGHPLDRLHEVAEDALTGPPVPSPIASLLESALGVPLEQVVELAKDPRFFSGVIPSANVVSTAEELSRFYQCLLDEGVYQGRALFEPRTIRRATAEQSYREIDLTLMLPIRYGNGLMLGDNPVGLFGPNTPHAFGHIGFTNIWGWADPARQISVSILTSGKPVVSSHVLRLGQLIAEINRAFPEVSVRRSAKPRKRPARRRKTRALEA